MGKADATSISPITTALARYIAGTPERGLPSEVVSKTKQHILDTLAAMLSGSRLKPGEMAAAYVKGLGGTPEATVIGSDIVTAAANAALANGMMGHADETDDSHLGGRFHPGCAIVPAALAVAEQQKSSGLALINAVALGYDVGARLCPALGLQRADASRYSTHSLGGAFGAAAAGAALLRLNERQARHVLSFAAQQASGIPFWNRDPEHIEKAFDFGGMGARNGVWAASMIASGFTATEDPLSGKHNLFAAFGNDSGNPEALSEGLGTRYEILAASIKKWSVGSPIQAALDSITALIDEHKLKVDSMRRMIVHMPDDRLHIVSNAPMPDICLQYLLAVTLADGTLTFASAHDEPRMDAPDIRAIRERIEARPSKELTEAKPARQAIVEIETNDGRKLSQRTRAVRGTPDNPMTQDEIDRKASDLMVPVIGRERAETLVAMVNRLEALPSVLMLRPLLQP
jgi:2-methylcitrate dehydratase PrpD